jgi:hypothetical protein
MPVKVPKVVFGVILGHDPQDIGTLDNGMLGVGLLDIGLRALRLLGVGAP